MNKLIAGMAILLIVAGCDKPNPNPELSDPIYMDIQKQLRASQAQLTAETKTLQEAKSELLRVVPQTGQIKFAQKRVYDAQAYLLKTQQQVQYFEIRLKSRFDYSRTSYHKAYQKKKEWPDPGEYKDYKTQLRLDAAPKQWSVKQRMIDAGLPAGIKNPAKKGPEDGKTEAPPSH